MNRSWITSLAAVGMCFAAGCAVLGLTGCQSWHQPWSSPCVNGNCQIPIGTSAMPVQQSPTYSQPIYSGQPTGTEHSNPNTQLYPPVNQPQFSNEYQEQSMNHNGY